jgi:hypothetical protein
MIQDKSQGVQIQDNMPGEVIQMTVRAANMAHILNIVTDFYSDRELAVVREYSTNAYDAHVEAGVKRPIEVTLPSALSPFLKIRDFGAGLDEDDIREVYSAYGASTKGHSNAFNGMLGLGSKSALSYGPQFLVNSVKNGIRIQVSVTRTQSGAEMKIVDQSLTQDPSGVEIIIPTKAGNTFERKAKDFYKYWPAGSVLVNGVAPERVDGLWLDDKLCIIRSNNAYHRINYVVMGNVPYPIAAEHMNMTLPFGHALVAFVPIGSVAFVPSREALDYGVQTTLDTLATLKPQVAAGVRDAAQKDIDASATHREAMQKYLGWLPLVKHFQANSAPLAYKGSAMPREITAPAGGRFVLTENSNYRLGSSSTYTAVTAESIQNSVWVYGYDLASFTPTHKKKLRQYCDENNISGHRHFVLSDQTPDLRWMPEDRIIDWADVAQIKLPRSPSKGSSGRLTGSFDCFVNGAKQWGYDANSIPRDGSVPVFYVQGNLTAARWYMDPITKFVPQHVVVCVPANRLAKFHRDFPKARAVADGVKDAYDKWSKTVKADELLAADIAGSYYLTRELAGLVKIKDRLDDPALVRAANLCTLAQTDSVATLQKMLNVFKRYDLDTTAAKFENPLKDYPLYDENAPADALVRYLNSEYEYRQNSDLDTP